MDSITVDIRRVSQTDDLDAICAQIQPDLWGKDNEMTSYQVANLKKFLQQNGILLLAYSAEKIVGIALCYDLPHPATTDHSFYVHELDTHPDFRQRGIATRLMAEASRVAKELGATEVWLGTETDNDPANALYKKLGPYEIEQSVTYAYKVK